MVEDALAVKPSTRAVPPVRSTSAATSVISSSPGAVLGHCPGRGASGEVRSGRGAGPG